MPFSRRGILLDCNLFTPSMTRRILLIPGKARGHRPRLQFCDIVTEAEFEMDDLNLSTQWKTQLVLLVVDPYPVHAYWEISPEIREAINLAGETKGVLRFYREGERAGEDMFHQSF